MSKLEPDHCCRRLLATLCVEDGVAGRYQSVIFLCSVKGYRIDKAGGLYEVVFDSSLVPEFVDGPRVVLAKVVSVQEEGMEIY